MSLALEWKGIAAREGCEREAGETRKAAAAVRDRQRSRRTRLVFTCFLAVAVAVSGLLIFSVCLHVSVVQNEMKIREIERQIELERRLQESLRAEIATLESPARVEDIAVNVMHMVQATLAEYLETPAYQAARDRESEPFSEEEAMVSDAERGGP